VVVLTLEGVCKSTFEKEREIQSESEKERETEGEA